jgi:hypothetical protein
MVQYDEFRSQEWFIWWLPTAEMKVAWKASLPARNAKVGPLFLPRFFLRLRSERLILSPQQLFIAWTKSVSVYAFSSLSLSFFPFRRKWFLSFLQYIKNDLTRFIRWMQS